MHRNSATRRVLYRVIDPSNTDTCMRIPIVLFPFIRPFRISMTWPKCIVTGFCDFLCHQNVPVRARYIPVYRECNSVSRSSRQIFLDIYGTSDDTSASPLKISSPMARPSVQMSGNSGCLRYELTFRD